MEQTSTEVIKTQTQLCKEEIELIMAKYPTCILNVQHVIQVQEIVPPVVEDKEEGTEETVV